MLLQLGTFEHCMVDVAMSSCWLFKVLQSSMWIYEFPGDKKQSFGASSRQCKRREVFQPSYLHSIKLVGLM